MTEEAAPLQLRHSLRAKGWLATLALLAYVLGASLYIASERARIYATMQSLEQVAQHEKALALTEAAVGGAVIDASVSSSAEQSELASPREMQLYMENCTKLFAALQEFDPAYALPYRQIERAFGELMAAPSRSTWIGLREALHRASDDLEIRHQRVVNQRDELQTAYRRLYDAVTVESLALAALGLLLFGTLAAWFFTRLAQDIRRLEQHARQIVQGRRGVSLPVQRKDELGHLIRAVNRMAVDLDEREQQIRIDAERHGHQQKMLAVGALAAGVAHEVNNPLAVISSLAEELKGDGAADPKRVSESAALIVAQTQRAARAARHLAEVAAPQPEDVHWDLNAQLRDLVQLTAYDRRYRRFVFDIDADPVLPAVCMSASAVQQVLMQLLTLVCEAHVAGSAPTIVLATRLRGDHAEVTMQFESVLDFSRPEVQRSLLLARAIAEPMRLRLAFGQAEDAMQRIKLTLPLDAGTPQHSGAGNP